jgi:hypothetical protein
MRQEPQRQPRFSTIIIVEGGGNLRRPEPHAAREQRA